MVSPKDYFGITCPEDGDFYICEGDTYEFVGCCLSDPCANGGECPTLDLREMSFQSNMYEELPPQLCPENDGSAWYSCKFTEPPFLGCCLNNPCNTGNFPDGCGRENLTQGRLADDESARFSFVSLPALAEETGSATANSKPASTMPTTPTPTGADATATADSAAPEAPDSSSNNGLSTGGIVGIAVGAVVFAAICLAALSCWCGWSYRGRKNKQRQTQEENPEASAATQQLHQPSPYHESFYDGGGYYDQCDKYQSPQVTQYGSPNTMFTDQTAVQGGGYHSRHTSSGMGYGLGVQEMEPQELPATSAVTPELPTDGDGRLTQPYDTAPANYGIAPDATPHQDSFMGGLSPQPSPGVGADNRARENRRSARRSRLSEG